MKGEIEKRLEGIAGMLDTGADSEKQAKLRKHVMGQFNEAATTNKNKTRHSSMRYLPRLAAALLVGVAIAGGVWSLIGEGGPTTVHAQVLRAIENSKQAEWVQYVDPANANQVFLNSFNPLQFYARYSDGRMNASLPEQNSRYDYTPISNTLEITYMPSTPIDRASGVLEMMTLQLKQFSLEWKKTEGEDSEGRKVWLYSSEHPQGTDTITIQLSVNPASERVTRLRMDHENNPERSIDYPLAYPETGPADIYEFGVPRDAIVIDYTPSEQALELSKTLFTNIAEGLAPAYRTVSIRQTGAKLSSFVEVFYREGEQFRQEYYRTSDDADWARLAKASGTVDAETAHRWLEQSQRTPVFTNWFEIGDDQNGLHSQTVEYQTWYISSPHQLLTGKKTNRIEDDHLVHTRYTDPSLYEDHVKYPSQTTYRYDLSRGGILVDYRTEFKAQFPWLHDKNWMGSETASGYDPDHHQVNSVRILESKQSPTGKWYATRIERIFPKNGNAVGEPQTTIVSIFVDFDVEKFEVGFFDDPEKQ